MDGTAKPCGRPLCDRLLPVLAGIGALILLCIMAINIILMPQLDNKLEQAVRREFALADDAGVRIQRGSLSQTLHGYLPHFTVTSDEAVIDEMPVEDLKFSASGMEFNMRGILNGEKAQLSDLRRAALSIMVSEQQLQQRLGPLIEEEGLLEPQLTILEDGVKLTAKKKNKLLGRVKLSAKGVFIADGSDSVRFELRDLELGQINVGISGLGLEFAHALPVLDMGGFAGNIIVDEVHTSLGYLHVTAHTGKAL
jgi:hypothetical protein